MIESCRFSIAVAFSWLSTASSVYVVHGQQIAVNDTSPCSLRYNLRVTAAGYNPASDRSNALLLLLPPPQQPGHV